VAKSPEKPGVETPVALKDPQLSAFLAWLIPGLGHLYQGRTAKAALFFVCIMGTFVYGLYLGSSNDPVVRPKGGDPDVPTIGWGRVVYSCWREGYTRLPYLCQIGVGLPAMPALIQANRMANNKRVWWSGFMAPPRIAPLPGADVRDDANADQPTPHELHLKLHRYFELGTVYTMIAGLLNVLAIYDAWGGPVLSETAKKEDDAEKAEEEAKTDPEGPPSDAAK
jgi:hypothetical protein